MTTKNPILASLIALSLMPLTSSAASSLPKPFGVGVNFYTLDQGLTLKEINANLFGMDLSQYKDQVGVKNTSTATGITVDYWVKPYLNLAAGIGHFDGKTTLDTSQISPANFQFTLPPIYIDYNGLSYNLAATLALGNEHLFGTLTYNYTQTQLNDNTEISAAVLSPSIGTNTQYGTFRFGGISIDATERHQGTYHLEGIASVPYDVVLKTNSDFNYFLAYSKTLGNDVQLDLKAGLGKDKHYALSVKKRF